MLHTMNDRGDKNTASPSGMLLRYSVVGFRHQIGRRVGQFIILHEILFIDVLCSFRRECEIVQENLRT